MSIRKIAEVADAVLIPVIINLSILQILNGDTYEKNNPHAMSPNFLYVYYTSFFLLILLFH